MSILQEGICSQLNTSIINQCKAIGIQTVIDFISADAEILAVKIGAPYKDIATIRIALLTMYSAFPQRADSLFEEFMERASLLDTGNERFNQFLGGGIYTGEITEVSGPAGAGKTQVCLSVVSNLISQTRNTAIYIDTSGNFVASRVTQMITPFKDEQFPERRLMRLKVVNAYDIYNLFNVLVRINHGLHKQEEFYRKVKLIVVDSITCLLSPCFGGSQFNFSGPGLMMNIAEQLKILCHEYMLSIMVCNDTVSDENGKVKPALGHNWKYIPSVILYVCKLNQNYGKQRKVSTLKSPRSGLYKELCFNVAETGIIN